MTPLSKTIIQLIFWMLELKTSQPNWQRKVISFMLYWLIVSNSAWFSKYLWRQFRIYNYPQPLLNAILNINLTNDISWDFHLIFQNLQILCPTFQICGDFGVTVSRHCTACNFGFKTVWCKVYCLTVILRYGWGKKMCIAID